MLTKADDMPTPFFFLYLVFMGFILNNSYIILLSKPLSNKTWLIIIVWNLSTLPQYLTVVMTVSTAEVLHLATDKVACQVWRQWCQKKVARCQTRFKTSNMICSKNSGLRKHFLFSLKAVFSSISPIRCLLLALLKFHTKNSALVCCNVTISKVSSRIWAVVPLQMLDCVEHTLYIHIHDVRASGK